MLLILGLQKSSQYLDFSMMCLFRLNVDQERAQPHAPLSLVIHMLTPDPTNRVLSGW